MAYAETIQFTLSREEHDFIINHAVTLDQSIMKKLRFGMIEGKRLRFKMDSDDMEDFVDALAAESNTAHSRKLRRRFEKIYNRLVNVLESSDIFGGKPDLSDITVNELKDIMRDIIQSQDSHGFAEVDELIEQVSEEYNHAPQSDFHGLSPLQTYNLIYATWKNQNSVISFNSDLDFESLKGSDIFTNTRVFLSALDESGPVKATATNGNLNRKFVLQMSESMTWPAGYIERIRSVNKVLNEEDIFLLHMIRVVILLAGLARKYKGSFRITKRGRQLLNEENSGTMFMSIFRTFFHKFNLAYLDYYPECIGIQQTIGFSLYALNKYCDDWMPMYELIDKLFLPSVMIDISADNIEIDDVMGLATTRVMIPLQMFGLLELRLSEDKNRGFNSIEQVRKTPLFDKFIKFDLSNA